ncbi:MAG: hypothetical protein M4D85_04270 [Actinomycetota bacterium]|nr:hypothetical protein [Actinomycetota bacterium]
MARKTVYIPDELLAKFESLQGGQEVNLSKVFQAFLQRTADKLTAMNGAIDAAAASPYWESVRPSMVRRFAQGAAYWTSVDLVETGNVAQAHALRAALEIMHVKVNLFQIGTPQHLVNILGGAEATAPFVVLSGMYAEDGTIPLPDLAPEITDFQPFHGRLTADQLRGVLDLPGRTVIALWGDMGQPAIAQAFLDAGCQNYVGPVGCPFPHTSLMFLTGLFYEMTQQRSFVDAVRKMQAFDDELGFWRLHQPSAQVRQAPA